MSGDRGSPKLKLQHTNFRRTPDAGVWPAPPGYQGGMRRVTDRGEALISVAAIRRTTVERWMTLRSHGLTAKQLCLQ